MMETYSGDALQELPPSVIEFLTERHLATLTFVRPDGLPSVSPVGFTYTPTTRIARVITWSTSFKAKQLTVRPHSPVALCQVDGGRWLTLYGSAVVTSDADRVSDAVGRYATRYRPPKKRSDRVVIEIEVNRVVGRT